MIKTVSLNGSQNTTNVLCADLNCKLMTQIMRDKKHSNRDKLSRINNKILTESVTQLCNDNMYNNLLLVILSGFTKSF
jgi:hypothetical protein